MVGISSTVIVPSLLAVEETVLGSAFPGATVAVTPEQLIGSSYWFSAWKLIEAVVV